MRVSRQTSPDIAPLQTAPTNSRSVSSKSFSSLSEKAQNSFSKSLKKLKVKTSKILDKALNRSNITVALSVPSPTSASGGSAHAAHTAVNDFVPAQRTSNFEPSQSLDTDRSSFENMETFTAEGVQIFKARFINAHTFNHDPGAVFSPNVVKRAIKEVPHIKEEAVDFFSRMPTAEEIAAAPSMLASAPIKATPAPQPTLKREDFPFFFERASQSGLNFPDFKL